ncbi:MAG TPA: hypothetical protein VM285_17350 [Polyangia bacterium]|nr:hypothetical protein [Polyangia bacterium]
MGIPLHAALAFASLLILAGPAGAAAPVPEGHTSLEIGACRLVLPMQNAGASGELAETCRDGAPRIFGQLGQKLDDGTAGLIQVRLVDDPARMAEAAPAGMPPPPWSGAVAYPGHDLVILALRNRDGSPAGDLRATLEHELSHMALRRALPEDTRVPRWFSEGIAIQQSEGSSLLRDGVLRWAGAGGSLLPLSAIERYPDAPGRVNLAYAQAAGFIGYLLQDGGWTGLRALLGRLGQGDDFEEAFEAIYGRSVSAAEREWRASLGNSLGWVALFTGTGALWGAITVLFILAVFAARRRHRRRLEAMAEEEQPVQRLIETFEQLKEALPPAPRKLPPFGGIPPRTKVVVKGRIHTLH